MNLIIFLLIAIVLLLCSILRQLSGLKTPEGEKERKNQLAAWEDWKRQRREADAAAVEHILKELPGYLLVGSVAALPLIFLLMVT